MVLCLLSHHQWLLPSRHPQLIWGSSHLKNCSTTGWSTSLTLPVRTHPKVTTIQILLLTPPTQPTNNISSILFPTFPWPPTTVHLLPSKLPIPLPDQDNGITSKVHLKLYHVLSFSKKPTICWVFFNSIKKIVFINGEDKFLCLFLDLSFQWNRSEIW